ncbi:MAG: hypothetical protein ABI843_10620 [Dokdonella sp.]
MIDGTSEVSQFAIDLHEHLVKMPSRLRHSESSADSFLLDFAGEQRPEPVPPLAHCLVTDVDPAFVQKIFDMAE